MNPIRVALVGIGNCASSLVQGLHHYNETNDTSGLIYPEIGGYKAGDLAVVLGFDVDARKVGRDVAEAIFTEPNNASVFAPDCAPLSAPVLMGRVADGVPQHMTGCGARGFEVADATEADQASVVAAIVEHDVDVLVNFLPVGSEEATRFYMECALEAGVAVVNCIPVFIASDPEWERRFRERGLPIVGDDIKAQIGATIVHRMLSQLFAARGVEIDRTYQLNTGGNTDFMNMMDRSRIRSKKVSKTEAVQHALGKRLEKEEIVIGPSEYVPWQKDNKVCFLRIEGRQFGGLPMHLEMRLSVEDSPNAAACVIDAIRFCKQALDTRQSGALDVASAFYCKHPPRQMAEDRAYAALQASLATMAIAAE